jgi:hypothetical protein
MSGNSNTDKFERSIRSYWPTAAGIVAAAAVLYWSYVNGHMGLPQVVTMAIGGAVGAVEIMGRYRHAPLRAALSWSGYSYILVNVVASWAAYYLLGIFDAFHDQTPDRKAVELVLAAGFGALVVLRSSFFKVRVGDTDVGIGPAALLDTLLLIADRGVDRREAVARAQDVSSLVLHVRDYRVVANMLTKYCLALMQNVDEKTSTDLGEAIGKILSDADIPNAIKLDIVALRLGVVVGPDVLEAAVEALGDRLNAAPAQPPASALPSPPAGAAANFAADFKAEIDAERATSQSARPAAKDEGVPA